VNFHLILGLSLYQLGDFKASEKALLLSIPKNVSPEAFYYLGEMYYQNYRFVESVDHLNKYIAHSKTDPVLKAKAEARLPFSQAGSRLMKGVERVQIIDSIVVDKTNFLQYYRLSQEAGKVKPTANFTSLYQNQRNDKVLFSQVKNSSGYDLFTQSRLMDSWGDSVALPDNINTAANENFPYVLSDGVTLYFSSDRPGAVGGCDIFITRYNLATESYLTPENIGMPFNSIFNDYMLAIDEQNNIGWFASDRFQRADKVAIYIFIPNENKIIAENESSQRLIQLAQIHSIRQTWKKEVDYSVVMNKIEMTAADSIQRVKGVSSFRWVLNDRTIYYSWSQFKSEDAKNYYVEYLKTADVLTALRTQLDALRRDFAQSEKARQKELTNAILATEKQEEELQLKQRELEQKARKIELAN
jgi:hypothetical protein